MAELLEEPREVEPLSPHDQRLGDVRLLMEAHVPVVLRELERFGPVHPRRRAFYGDQAANLVSVSGGVGVGDRRDHVMLPDESMTSLVQQLFHVYVETRSDFAVRDWLQARKIPVPNGNPVWSVETLRDLLCNRRYIGEIEINKQNQGRRARSRRLPHREGAARRDRAARAVGAGAVAPPAESGGQPEQPQRGAQPRALLHLEQRPARLPAAGAGSPAPCAVR